MDLMERFQGDTNELQRRDRQRQVSLSVHLDFPSEVRATGFCLTFVAEEDSCDSHWTTINNLNVFKFNSFSGEFNRLPGGFNRTKNDEYRTTIASEV